MARSFALQLLLTATTLFALVAPAAADEPVWEESYDCEAPLQEIGRVDAGTIVLATRWFDDSSCFRMFERRLYLRPDDGGPPRFLTEIGTGGMNCARGLEDLSFDGEVLRFVEPFASTQGLDAKTRYTYRWNPEKRTFSESAEEKLEFLTHTQRIYAAHLADGRLVRAAMVGPDWYDDRYNPYYQAEQEWKAGVEAMRRQTKSVSPDEAAAMWEWFAVAWPHHMYLQKVAFEASEGGIVVRASDDAEIDHVLPPKSRPTPDVEAGLAAIRDALKEDRLDLAVGHFMHHGLADHRFTDDQYEDWVKLVRSWALRKHRLGNACAAWSAMQWLLLDRPNVAPRTEDGDWRDGGVLAMNDAMYFAQHCPHATISARERAEHLEQIVEDRPKRAAAWLNLGDARLEMGRHVEAIAAFDRYATLRRAAGKPVPSRVNSLLAPGALVDRADRLLLDAGAPRPALELYRMAAERFAAQNGEAPLRVTQGAEGTLHLRRARTLAELGFVSAASKIVGALPSDAEVPDALRGLESACYSGREVRKVTAGKLRSRAANLRQRLAANATAMQKLAEAKKTLTTDELSSQLAEIRTQRNRLEALVRDLAWWVAQLPDDSRAAAEKTWFGKLRRCMNDAEACQ